MSIKQRRIRNECQMRSSVAPIIHPTPQQSKAPPSFRLLVEIHSSASLLRISKLLFVILFILAAPALARAAQSDLIVQNLSVSPASGRAGSSIAISFTIRNQGSGGANASTTHIRISNSTLNVTTSDPLLALISTPSITQGGVYQVSRTVAIPSSRTPGAHYIWVILDVNSTANQSNESNDKANVPFIVLIPSDLVPQNLIVTPTSGLPGTDIAFSFSIRNQGPGQAAPSTTRIWLNTSSSTVTMNDYLLASINIPALAAGAVHPVAQILKIPANRNPGTHYIWVVVDAESTANQNNENNDKARVAFTVTAPPSDLVVQNLALSKMMGNAGISVTVSFTIRNQGIGTANASTTHIRLAGSNSQVTDKDTLLASFTTPSLVAGGTSDVIRNITIPSNKAPGAYYVWVILDAYSRANQSNENNDKANTKFIIDCLVPVVTTQPGSRVISSGGRATISVTAQGTPPLTYQWYKGVSGDTSNPISGATLGTLTTPTLTSTTNFWVRVNNVCGSINSNPAMITVNTPTNLIVEVLDPACTSSTGCAGGYLVESGEVVTLHPDARELSKAMVRRVGAATDGVTRLLLRVKSNSPVTFSMRLATATPSPAWGWLTKRDGSQTGLSLTVSPDGGFAFAVYQTPKDFPADLPRDRPMIIIEATAGAASGRATITLRPPPIVLVHGVWSCDEAWAGLEDFLKQNYGYDICNGCRVNYGWPYHDKMCRPIQSSVSSSIDPSVGSFDPEKINSLTPNLPVKKLVDAMNKALEIYRRANIAVTQVDVVSHSLGGLLARSRVALKPVRYQRKENYNQGDFHKLITVGTPHHGSPLANFLVKHRCDTIYDITMPTKPTFLKVQELFAARLNKSLGPAIFEFQTASAALQHLSETKVPSHTVIGKKPDLSVTYGILNGIISAIDWKTSLNEELDILGNHDTIVPFDSQRGGLSGEAKSLIRDIVHADLGGDVSETSSGEVWEEIARLLHEKVDSPSFAPELPKPVPSGPAALPYEIACPAALMAVAPFEQTVSGTLTPTAGTVVRPGEVIQIIFTLDGGNPIDGVLFIIGGRFYNATAEGPFSLSYTVPTDRAGEMEISALTYGPGPVNYTLSTKIIIAPSASPIALNASPRELNLTGIGEEAQLLVSGQFADGEPIDLTRSTAGTLYALQSGNTNVVSINADGLVEARGFGRETILITNSDKTTKVEVKVAPPDDPSSDEVTSVSAASYESDTLATESIIAAFGSGLASTTAAANTRPLPTTLAGTTVKITDSVGTEYLAPLFFVSPMQINYQIPPDAAPGPAIVEVMREDGATSFGIILIDTVAPGLFTADASGKGLASAVALRVKADGSQIFEPIVRFDPSQNKFVAVPIDLGPDLGDATDQVFLILFGTGIRFRSDLSAVSAKIGGVDAQVLYAGEQSVFVGLDQINVRLPRSLIGRGEVDITLMADSKPANTVKVRIR